MKIFRKTNAVLKCSLFLFVSTVLLFGCSSGSNEDVATDVTTPNQPSHQEELSTQQVASKSLTLKEILSSPDLLTLNDTFKGEILEVKDIKDYTFLKMKDPTDTAWVAVSRTSKQLEAGESVQISNASVMSNFISKTLNKTFDLIIFGQVVGMEKVEHSIPTEVSYGGQGSSMSAGEHAAIKVEKATGSNAYTVEEIFTKSDALKDKEIVVRGTIVKYNEGIMGKNWLHLQDGTGSAENHNNDITVTTDAHSVVGATVVAKGVLHVGKDFGAGYSFDAIIEDAHIQIDQ